MSRTISTDRKNEILAKIPESLHPAVNKMGDVFFTLYRAPKKTLYTVIKLASSILDPDIIAALETKAKPKESILRRGRVNGIPFSNEDVQMAKALLATEPGKVIVNKKGEEFVLRSVYVLAKATNALGELKTIALSSVEEIR
jgi:hypothetical protein